MMEAIGPVDSLLALSTAIIGSNGLPFPRFSVAFAVPDGTIEKWRSIGEPSVGSAKDFS
jgi:hypothetical protein